jgi:hypothetical protein
MLRTEIEDRVFMKAVITVAGVVLGGTVGAVVLNNAQIKGVLLGVTFVEVQVETVV